MKILSNDHVHGSVMEGHEKTEHDCASHAELGAPLFKQDWAVKVDWEYEIDLGGPQEVAV